MTIVIHAGLKKCGSSSVHAFLNSNRELLQTFDIDYPGPGRPGTKLANEIRGRKKFGSARGILSQLVEYWEKAPAKTMVLSSEMLEPAEQNEVVLIKQAFLNRKRHDDFVIVFIIRDLTELVPSIYAQKIKNNTNARAFDEFFDSIIEEGRVNYFRTARKWANVFGWENMRIRLLDRKELVNHDLADDFLSILGIDPARSQSLVLNRPGISNAASGWRVIEAVRALFKGSHDLPENHPLIAAISREGSLSTMRVSAAAVGERYDWNKDKGYYLTREQAQRCLQIYTTNVERLNKKLAQKLATPLDLDSRGFQERQFMPDVSKISANDLRSFYDDLWSELCRKDGTGS